MGRFAVKVQEEKWNDKREDKKKKIVFSNTCTNTYKCKCDNTMWKAARKALAIQADRLQLLIDMM